MDVLLFTHSFFDLRTTNRTCSKMKKNTFHFKKDGMKKILSIMHSKEVALFVKQVKLCQMYTH